MHTELDCHNGTALSLFACHFFLQQWSNKFSSRLIEARGGRHGCPPPPHLLARLEHLVFLLLFSKHAEHQKDAENHHNNAVRHHELGLIPLADAQRRSALQEPVDDEVFGLNQGHEEEKAPNDEDGQSDVIDRHCMGKSL